MPKRLAAVGAAAALATGTLVAAGSAQAAVSVDTNYDCGLAGPVAVTIAQNLITDGMTLPAGFDAPNLPLDITATLSEATTSFLKSSGVTSLSASSDDMKIDIAPAGSTTPIAQVALIGTNFPATAMPDSGAVTLTTPPGDGSEGFPAATNTFNAPPAGTFDVLLPTSFTFHASSQGGELSGSPYTCTLADGATSKFATLSFSKNASATTARITNGPLHKGDRGKLAVKVTAPNQKPTGRVVVKKGTKTIGTATLRRGKAVIRLAKLPVGRNKIVVKYAGDGYTKASRDAMKVRVRR